MFQRRTTSVALSLAIVLSLLAVSCGSAPEVNLTGDPRTGDRSPSWSPDGTRIVFVSYKLDDVNGLPTATEAGVYIMDADGGNRERLPVDVPARSLSWSPDGMRIVLAAGGGVATVKADGSDLSPLVAGSLYGISDWASYSPDGSRIVYGTSVQSESGQGEWKIMVVDTDGGNQACLTPDGVEDYAPAWSPDGQKIAFDSRRGRDGRGIYVMDPDGSNPTKLTKTGDPAGDAVAWSPDGSRIAFAASPDDQRDIFIMDAGGDDVTRLTDNSISEISLSWSPDGERIAFGGQPGSGESQIYVIEVPA